MASGGRGQGTEPGDLLWAEFEAVGGNVLLDARHSLSARNRSDVVAFGKQPRRRLAEADVQDEVSELEVE